MIVAHGAPSEPAPQQRAVEALAARVGAELPGARILGATLAAPGAFAAALAECAAPVVYPFFMARGWFTGTVLPRELVGAGRSGVPILPPFGTDPEFEGLVRDAALDGARAAGTAAGGATLLLAAHGSRVSRGSAEATEALMIALASGPFGRVRAGFIEEAPFLVDAARAIAGPALCLPLFALAAGHVTGDIPDALAAAGFEGPLLPPVGAHSAVPGLIAAAIARETARIAT